MCQLYIIGKSGAVIQSLFNMKEAKKCVLPQYVR